MHKYQWTATASRDLYADLNQIEMNGLIVNPVELTDHEIKERISIALKDQKCSFFDFDYKKVK